ncbi:hypothetical protein KJ359_007031 [Pestalotiopsis sp. 9143b]|nr:hypothetical protein KJ359_007031 [Pestalotiopsis sp. 9143b]
MYFKAQNGKGQSSEALTALQTPTPEGGPSTASSVREVHGDEPDDAAQEVPPGEAFPAVDKGRNGWVIVLSCAVMNFFFSGFSGSWGVLQAALLAAPENQSQPAPASTFAWVGSLSLALTVGCGLLGVRLLPVLGAKKVTLLGELLFITGVVASGFTTGHLDGLFVTSGALTGTGTSLLFMITNCMATQYFSGSAGGRLGLANGVIKLGGGVGAAVFSVALEAMNRRLGIAWTFRIFGLLALAVAVPAAFLIREKMPFRRAPLVDVSMLRCLPFVAVCVSSMIYVFALYIPPYYLPLFAQSIGLSSAEAALVTAGYNLAAAFGRFAAGPLCDWIGALNSLLLIMVLNAITLLAIWPVSTAPAPLIVFALLNGVANGGFFTAMPSVFSGFFEPSKGAMAVSTGSTGWTLGYLLGTPIAGYLFQAASGSGDISPSAYRPAIFYAGGVGAVACGFALLARLSFNKVLIKRA